MKKVWKTIAVVLSFCLLCSAFAGCGNSDGSSSGSAGDSSVAEEGQANQSESGEDGERYTITMAYIGNEQPRQAEVLAEVNELVQEEMNMNFETVQLSFGDYQQRLNLMLSGGDKLDILPVMGGYANGYVNSGYLVDMTDLIQEYGQGIIDFMGEDIALSGNIGGVLYGIPANKESNNQSGIVMRKDIVDELGIDVSSIHVMEDLREVFAKVKEAHPEIDCFAGTNFVSKITTWDTLGDGFGVLDDYGFAEKVTNQYESELYKNHAILAREFYEAGYIKLDAATTTETTQNLVKAGTLFSYISPIKPGFLIQENVACGTEMVTQYLEVEDGTKSNIIASGNVHYFDWGIAHQSEDPAKAMQFLNFAYTSPEWNNLMNFGIEGVDYVPVEGSEVLIDYPEGTDATSAYHLNMGWMLPNQFIGYVWNGQPEDVWDQYQAFNDDATYSDVFGFFFDSSELSTELTALTSVRDEYVKSLETGSMADVENALKEFNEKLYAAGLQKYMDAKQEQVDAWRSANGK